MKPLSELADVYKPNTNRQGNLIRLFEFAKNKEFEKREDAIQYFYGETPNSEGQFRVLYKKLKDHLVHNGVFTVPLSTLTEIQRAHVEAFKKYSASKILIALEKKAAGIKLANETLQLALKYQLIDISLSLTRELQSHYAIVELDKTKYVYFTELTNKLLEDLQAEIKAQNCYTDVVFALRKNTPEEETIDLMKGYVKELKSYWRDDNSFKFFLYYYTLTVTRFQLEGNYSKAIEQSKRALDHFESSAVPLPYTSKFVFNNRLVYAYTQLGDFDNAKKALDNALKYPSEGSYNWDVTLQSKVFLGFHSEKPIWAYHAYKKATEAPKKFNSVLSDEAWRIYKAYLVYYKKIRKLNINENIRLYKFLNEVPEYSKDKRGTNVAILIIQMLILLVDKRMDEFMNRTDSLKAYMHRHLRRNATYRSEIFIRFLLKLEPGRFRKQTVERLTSNLREKLNSHSQKLNIIEKKQQWEIIPYEILWDEVLDLLK